MVILPAVRPVSNTLQASNTHALNNADNKAPATATKAICGSESLSRCGTTGCHPKEVYTNRKQLMATGCMLWGAALYNNGAVPHKVYRYGQAYGPHGEPLKLTNPPPRAATFRKKGPPVVPSICLTEDKSSTAPAPFASAALTVRSMSSVAR